MKTMKGKKYTVKRRIRFLAAAALTAALIGGQVYPALAQNEQAETEVMNVIPENITIDEPAALGDVSLPESEYGTLSWADPSYVPSLRVESCGVIFTPAESVDLSWMSGWDEAEGVWRGTVTVVVTSLGEPEEDSAGEAGTETAGDSGSFLEKAASGEGSGENGGESPEESAGNMEESPENAGDGAATVQEPAGDPEKSAEKSGGDTAVSGDTVAEPGETDGDSGASGTEDKENSQSGQEADGNTPEAGADDSQTGETGSEGESGSAQDSEGTADGDSQASDPENSGTVPEASDGGNAGAEDAGEPDNIFDRTQAEADDRPMTAEENLTEEEQLARAAENHTCDGIYVSGISLPWYVQFRATSGETYEFANEKTASIFKSYELELWDLKSGTEYEIPEGEYVSVTVPVKEGYEYTVEHILDNGAVETILPSVEGSTMVFSTHSFSPFGIAGSKPVVGDDVTDKNYPSTPTPTPTRRPGTTAAPRPSSSPSGGNGSSTPDKDNAGYTNNGNGNSSGTADKDNAGYTNNGNGSSSGTVDKDNAGYADNGNGSSSGTVSKDNAGYADDSNDSSSSSRAVATGDNTLIYPFIVLLAADLLLILAVIAVKKRRAH